MGAGDPVSDADGARRASTRVSPARRVQCPFNALRWIIRAVAHDAQRFHPLAGYLPTAPMLDLQQCVRAETAAMHRIVLEVVKLPDAKHGFVLLPRPWVVERTFGWLVRFRRLARDYKQLPETLAGLHMHFRCSCCISLSTPFFLLELTLNTL